MTRRGFIRRVLLQLLVIVFGPRVMELLEHFERLTDAFESVHFRMDRYVQLLCSKPQESHIVFNWEA